jgi:hypothetical protein
MATARVEAPEQETLVEERCGEDEEAGISSLHEQ